MENMQWQSGGRKIKGKKRRKKRRGRKDLSFLFTDQSERGRVSESRHAGRGGGGGGLAICVQVRDEPIRTRLHVSHRVMG